MFGCNLREPPVRTELSAVALNMRSLTSFTEVELSSNTLRPTDAAVAAIQPSQTWEGISY
ncbi:MAG: hypothetical protein ACTS4V_01270 [Candidatus Hodgkinia cicadicola]